METVIGISDSIGIGKYTGDFISISVSFSSNLQS